MGEAGTVHAEEADMAAEAIVEDVDVVDMEKKDQEEACKIK